MSGPDEFPSGSDAPEEGRLTRRTFLRKSSLSALALATIPAVVAACGGGSSSDGEDAAAPTTEAAETGAPAATGAAPAPSGSITVAAWGGSYNDDLKKYFGDPFTQETGVQVKFVANTSLAGLKQQVAAGAVQWDIAELAGSDYQIGVEQAVGMAPLNTDIVQTANIPEYAVGDYGIQYAFFTQVMGWNTEAVQTPPASWADFFDPDKFTVKRSLYDAMYDSFLLEFALMADGVPRDSIYPLDVDRAFTALERLPADKMLWYSTNQQVIQQLVDQESGLGMPYTGRVRQAAADGAPLEYTTTDAGALGDYFVVPEGAPNSDGAWAFINFVCNNAEAAAAFMETTLYGVSNLAAVELLPPEIKDSIPTNPAMQEKILMRDDTWWAENLAAVSERFLAWQASYS